MYTHKISSFLRKIGFVLACNLGWSVQLQTTYLLQPYAGVFQQFAIFTESNIATVTNILFFFSSQIFFFFKASNLQRNGASQERGCILFCILFLGGTVRSFLDGFGNGYHNFENSVAHSFQYPESKFLGIPQPIYLCLSK